MTSEKFNSFRAGLTAYSSPLGLPHLERALSQLEIEPASNLDPHELVSCGEADMFG